MNLKSEPFIPCVNSDGEELLATIDDIINDETGISASDFMADKDFISLSNTGCEHLPIKELRTSVHFHDFLVLHSPSEYDFRFDALKDVVSNDDFKEWLQNEDNDANFIKHLLNNGQLDNFSDKNIFIEAEGDLWCSGKLYYDFDSNMSRIDFLRNYIPHLSLSLKLKLEQNSKWKEYADDNFNEFEAESMLNGYILNDDDALNELNDIEHSVLFFQFVSEQDVSATIIENIPFFDEDGISQDDYSNTYFYSQESYNISKVQWLPKDIVTILSRKYLEDEELKGSILSKFKELGVSEFTHTDFIKDKLIQDSELISEINKIITDDFDSNLAFVKYLFENKDVLKDKDGQLKDYVLLCIDNVSSI